jgi:hypothetical protein
MPDLHELLDAEATRRRPDTRPDIAALVARHRARRRRRVAAGGLAVAAALIGGAVALRDGHVPIEPVRPPATSPSTPLFTVPGTLTAVGGPAGTGPTPLSGEVSFTAPDGRRWTAHVASDGRFTIAVPAGRYTVTAESPSYNDGRSACQTGGPVTVADSTTAVVHVVCPRK